MSAVLGVFICCIVGFVFVVYTKDQFGVDKGSSVRAYAAKPWGSGPPLAPPKPMAQLCLPLYSVSRSVLKLAANAYVAENPTARSLFKGYGG